MVAENRELPNRNAKLFSMPMLQEGTKWLTESKAKNDVLAKTFSSKVTLPPEAADTPYLCKPEAEYENL